MGDFLGIFAKTPAKHSSIVAKLLASCEESPFVTQFVYNLMGPIFYELTMMALPSEKHQLMTSQSCERIEVATILKFWCFVYLESALQYESTEDLFETLTFCGQYEVAELQEFCATSLKSFAENSHNRCIGSRDSKDVLGKRICDYLVLFLGGRIPFYFNEEELTLLHSVLIETFLDICCSRRSEFDIARSGLLWVQRKLMIQPLSKSPYRVTFEATSNNVQLFDLVNLRVVCSNSGVHISEDGPDPELLFYSAVLLLCSSIWTWIRLWRPRSIILPLNLTNPDSLEGIIAVKQPAVGEIIHNGNGS